MLRFFYDWWPLFLGLLIGSIMGNLLGNIIVTYGRYL